jgi:ankyrin repeat protein
MLNHAKHSLTTNGMNYFIIFSTQFKLMKITFTALLICYTTLTFGQNINEKLFKAVSNGDSTQVETLLNKGGDPNFKMKLASFEMSMLIESVQKQDFKIAKLLIEHKADVDYRDWFKTTALMYAANSGNTQIVKLLIAYHADPNAKDEQGNSVLSAAKESKNAEVIKLIGDLQKK